MSDWKALTSLPITHHPSPITHHPSPITHHPSPITHHLSPVSQSSSMPYCAPMTLASVRCAAGASFCVLLAACNLSTGPDEVQKLVDVQFDFCADDIPIW